MHFSRVCVRLQVLVCLAACVAMTACAFFPDRFDVVFGAFLLLEVSVGSSYAAYATLRARVIPEVPCATDFGNIARTVMSTQSIACQPVFDRDSAPQ